MTLSPGDISVVIPTYNRAALLERAIASVTAQTVTVGEIVIVDDGSTDDTRATVERLRAAHPAIVYVVQANSGANVARNTGITAATRPWIAFLDSDDMWMPEKIARQIAALAAKPAARASFCGIRAIDGDRILYDYDTPEHISLLEICAHNALGSTSTALVEKQLLLDVGLFDVTLPSCQDWDMWIHLRAQSDFALVPEPLLLYDDGPHDRITLNLRKALAGHRAVFARALAMGQGTSNRLWLRSRHLEVLSRMFQRHGQRTKAFEAAVRSGLAWPSRRTLSRIYRSGRAMLGIP